MTARLTHASVHDPIESILAILDEEGAVVVEDMLDPALLAQLNRELDPYLVDAALTAPDLNQFLQIFFGERTRRIGALPAKSRAFCDVLTHPVFLGVCDAILLQASAGYQMNVGQVIEVGPGATEQFLHRDEDVWVHVPRPAPTFQVASMTALVDFTAEIGATRVVPGSHRWERDRSAGPSEIAIAEMPAGSTAIYLGSTIHGAGANVTAGTWRRGIHLSYLVGWLRTEENNYLGVPPEVARDLPERVQEILGYAMHDAIASAGGVCGYVELRDPMKLLRESAATR